MQTIATEKLYYIMDAKSHYYRTNEKNQLVVASGEMDATVFSFTEANKRIGSGAKSKFYFMVAVPEEEQGEFKVVEESCESVEEEVREVTSAAKELVENEMQEECGKEVLEHELADIDWKAFLEQFIGVAENVGDYKAQLTKAESDVDQKICDVLHYIELCDLNCEESADLVELLKVCRENRRIIKDALFCADTFQRNLGTNVNLCKAKEALKAVKGLDNRKYTPRKFAELFEGSTIPVRRERRSQEVMQEVEPMEEMISHEEDICMDYVYEKTPFDGKENDWMAFAKQQVEFYSNANQYMINLRLDIEAIDHTIEDLMEEIETAKCNVTQGYQLFKRMKELRIERKAKEKEFESLRILTSYINVEKMAEEYTYNLEDLKGYLEEVPEEVEKEELSAV